MEKINKNIINFFSALSDETRLNILLSLENEPKNVNDIHKLVGRDRISLSGISHQLRLLKDRDIIVFEKKGKEKIFRLSDNFCWCILRDVFNHFKEK
ncbi:winged helix-turn-helix transcriptional regulator [Candidatus Woesearchaeota archaeon]|nr:winged helix-turn-helix transcriptional regulator [Candidatus Woesearchaeota archaeon]